MKPALKFSDYEAAAKELRCEVGVIKAVFMVEAPRGGFNPDETPVTLFEGHKFHEFTDGLFDVKHPTLSYKGWSRKYYGINWQAEQLRLQKAIALDRDAAIMATSWGKAQIMGFNYAMVGYPTIQAFVNAMYKDEAEHLKAFVQFVKRANLGRFLQSHNWAGFAEGYNGTGYALNKYDVKMANAYSAVLSGEA